VDSRRSAWLSVALLVALTEAVYFRPSLFHNGLLGSDYLQLHARHIAFARDALFGPGHFLPAWYPRELLGAPFAADVQSFPWIPTRLLLLLFDPKYGFAVGVSLAAALAAVFTYLFCKRIGLSDLGAISAGWTFACAGYFASRVMAGHLPMLEAYPALPLLLWLADRAVALDRARFQRRDLAALALAAACVALAGHPQLPAYSLGAALVYLFVRGRGRRLLFSASALALGVACTLFAWWPMILLIQRSTRVLDLAPPSNDIAMSYGRLLAMLWPGKDGWPQILGRQPIFGGYPNDSYFWDTASYIGLLPLAAILFLLVRTLRTKRLPAPPFAFLAVLGAGALLLSLPAAQPLYRLVHGTFFRSPSRLFYLCNFPSAVALGCAVNAFQMSGWLTGRARSLILAACLLGHAVDLGGFARLFIQPAPQDSFPREFEQVLSRELDRGRIAAEDPEYHGLYDDAGIFDSILLANPYRAMLGLAGLPRDLNVQRMDASEFPIPALQAAGVRFVITSNDRNDLALVRETEEENLYRVPNPAPRVAFFGGGQIDFVARDAALDAFLSHPRPDRLVLPSEAGTTAIAPGTDAPPAQLVYSRPSSDEIRVESIAPRPGFIRILDSYDPGWSATVDGAPVTVMPANGFMMAIAVEEGRHAIALHYQTEGRRLGWLLSLASVVLLGGLIAMARKIENPA
jgi:membrane protein YfhO